MGTTFLVPPPSNLLGIPLPRERAPCDRLLIPTLYCIFFCWNFFSCQKWISGRVLGYMGLTG